MALDGRGGRIVKRVSGARYLVYRGPYGESRAMRKTGNVQHYFTVRGRGFDLKEWSRILTVVEEIVDRAKGAGFPAKFEGDATGLVVSAPDVQEFRLIRKGEPNIPKEVVAAGRYDVVVQTMLAAIKKIAPDKFEMTCPDGRDYRRMLAKATTAPGHGSWGRMKRMDQLPKTKEEAFLKAMGKQKWRHPDTGNQVEFVSLPKKEQTKLRRRWEQEFGDRYQRALEKAKAEAEEAKKEVDEADDAHKDVKREKQKAEKARGLEEAYEKALKVADSPRSVGEAKTMNEDTIRKAAIRVAKTTDDPDLRRELLEILRPTVKSAKDDGEKESRFEEGKDVDVGTWLKENGYSEAARKWEKHEGEIGKKAAAAVVFPDIHELAWHHVLAFAKSHPGSKVASGSTADRVSASTHLAKKWISDAIERPGRVHKYLGIPEDEKIPVSKLDAAIEKVKGTGNKSLLSALLLAKRLKGMGKKAADDAWLNEESFAKAAADVWGAEHLAQDWIQDAIKRASRVREYLAVPEGENVPMGKIVSAIEKAKGSGNRSLISALLLAKRLKRAFGDQASHAAA